MTKTSQISQGPDRVPLGMALVIGFCVVAPMLDVCAKIAADAIPVGQITAGRFLVQTVLMLPVCLIMGLSLRLRIGLWLPVAMRALFLMLSTYFIIAALRFMPLADALAIVFVEPFIILLFGKVMFGEIIGPRRLLAAAVGFAGCLLVIQPSFVAFGYVALLPLGTAFTFAAYVLSTRSLRGQLHPVEMQFQTGLAATLMIVPLLWFADGRGWDTFDPVWPQGIYWMLIFGVGFFATVAHMMMTYALSMAPAATLAPLHYLEIIMAALLGYLFFDDFPNGLALAGIFVIMASGLYVIHRERVNARRIELPSAPI
ncbi:DMT family transporter [Octadecabacter sp. CECT 8868]|uniref:DMT family transporter n=1 Tax=Octadecabacter algicola TaxID=2909342 RepID=UPI001F168A45|nr:DMT family transporter [Octadecabacter algicola]MCF2904420.1 DMT family transporter [Octadecabacter algicola]